MANGIDVQPPPDAGPTPPGHAGSGLIALGGQPPADRKLGPYEDDEKILKSIGEAQAECFDNRWVYERIWWRNILYLLDRQWIKYDTQRGTWVDKRLAKWVPRPVTNKMRETHEAIAALMRSVDITIDAQPNGESPIDVSTAQTVTDLEQPIRLEHEMDKRLGEMDFWLIGCGNAILHPWWDKRYERGILTVQFEMCVVCQKVSHPADIHEAGGRCPGCGNSAMTLAMGQDGEPITQEIKIGKGATDICSPFEIAAPGHCTSMDEADRIIRKRWRPKSWYERYHPAWVREASPNWEKMPLDRSLQLLKSVGSQSDLPSQPFVQQSGGYTELEGLTEYELWEKPTENFPEGLVVRSTGEGKTSKIIRLENEGLPGPMPYRTIKGELIMPFVHCFYHKFGGRLWARSILDSLILKQDQLNQIDSLSQLIVTRTANPVWIEPKGAEVHKFTGAPGLVVKYNPAVAGGNAKPERLAGQNIPASVIKMRESIINDIENQAGTYEIIKGQKPVGVPSFAGIQALIERAQGRHETVLKNRGIAIRQWFEIAIELERQFGPLERTHSILGPNGFYTFRHFKSVDLQGAIRIQIQDGSQTPKTSLGNRAAIEQLRTLGVISPQNPDTAYRILQIFGRTDLWPGLDADVQAAKQEQDAFERWAVEVRQVPAMGDMAVAGEMGQPALQFSSPPPGQIKVWQSDVVHIAEHKKWANSDVVRQMLQQKPWIEPAINWMIEQHEQRLMIMQQNLLSPAPANGAPASEVGRDRKGVGAARSMERSNAESANPADVPSGQSQDVQGMGPV